MQSTSSFFPFTNGDIVEWVWESKLDEFWNDLWDHCFK